MTPQIKQEDLDEIKEMKKNKKSPFSPDYNDNPYMNDDDFHNEINDDGNLEFVESPEDIDDMDRDIDQDLVFDESEEEQDEEEIIDNYIYSKSVPSDGDKT